MLAFLIFILPFKVIHVYARGPAVLPLLDVLLELASLNCLWRVSSCSWISAKFRKDTHVAVIESHKQEEITRAHIRQEREGECHRHVFSGQKFLHWQISVCWDIVMVNHWVWFGHCSRYWQQACYLKCWTVSWQWCWLAVWLGQTNSWWTMPSWSKKITNMPLIVDMIF
jgi:hypothetical protein